MQGATRGGLALVLLFAALVVTGGAILLTPKPSAKTPLASPAGAPIGSEPAPLAPPLASARTHDPSAEPRGDVVAPERFAGRGRIRGEIAAGEGVTMPDAWTLVYEPSTFLSGAELAVSGRIDYSRGERAFLVDDLPLGGYRVRAEAPGLNSTAVDLMLVRSSADAYVTIVLSRAGLLDGRVLDSAGAPAEGVSVVLESRRDGVRRVMMTDAAGTFAFHDVLDGSWTLFVGPPESPLVPSSAIEFKAPTLRVKEVALPSTGSLAITTRDTQGTPVLRCEVTGFGAPRGAVSAVTGDDGRALVRWLPPGEYRLEAKSADGRTARIALRLAAGETADARFEL